MHLLQIHEPGHTPAPHANNVAAPAVGIDLGTTHTLLARYMPETGVEFLKDTADNALFPSVVRDFRSIKRWMGKGKQDYLHAPGPYTLAETADDRLAFAIPGGQVTAVEISAAILKQVRMLASQTWGQEITQAVITVPAYFDDTARTATRDAARLAGLEVLRLLNEPTAAAVAYGLDQQSQGTYLVYDLGGGTFDVTLLRIEKGIFQVLASAGDTTLGGDDIDILIAARCKIDTLQARQVKEALSTQEQVQLADTRLNRADLETMAMPLLTRTLAIATQTLADGKTEVNALAGIILVGGATRMPLVQRLLQDTFSLPLLTELDPDMIVAHGAAIQAHQLTHGSNHLLLDVNPLSLGIETMGGIVEKIIPRNSPIPTKASNFFTTYQDGQTGLKLHIVQGERELAQDCRSLAHFELKGIPPMKAGVARIETIFMLDADGLLSVTAQEQTSGISQTIEIKPTYGLDIGTIENILLSSLDHAEEDMRNRLLRETRMEGERHILAVIQALEEDGKLLTIAENATITAALSQLQALLASEDRDAIHAGHLALEHAIAPLAEKQLQAHFSSHLEGKSVASLQQVLDSDKKN